MKHILKAILLLIFTSAALAQSLVKIDPAYYLSPVKIPIFLSGNFAELRPNHFHAGIDIKTQGRTGLPVFAAADGFVSRISISPVGYGKVLYLNHPNGTTTVYGHLNSFSPSIEEYIRKIQYKKESFAVDQQIANGVLLVQKGELIAQSGNSGSSGGPHLHFEIRRTVEETYLNPLLFNFPVKDKIRPVIQALIIYPVSDASAVMGKHQEQKLETIKVGDNYQLKNNVVIPVYGKIGLGIQAIDMLDGNPNKCGVFSITLSVDSKVIYSFSMDDLVISESRYINSHLDYERAIRTGQRFYRSWLEPGNKLSIYDQIERHGIINATDDQEHQVKYEVTDVAGNSTSLSFKFKATEIKLAVIEPIGEHFKYNRNNHIRNDELEFSVPEGALYNDVDFVYSPKPGLPKFYSSVYQLHNPYTALHFACPLKIKADKLPAELQSKAMLAQVDPVSGKIYSATGKFINGWVEGNIRVLGNYCIAVDQVPPKITPFAIQDKKTKKVGDKIQFKISDNLSGIETYRGTIDGNWVLFEYDLKNNLLSYTFDKGRFQFNKNHSLILEVADYKGNISTYKTNFYK
jgi:murein DD-endopeptidase MepM/ murein hydrolase activator NlpD